MGWTGQSKGNRSTHEVIVEELEGVTDDGRTWEVVDHSGKYYALKLPTGDIIGVVVLTEHERKGQWDTWIYTKVISEDMGPYERECPTRILDKLTPIDKLDSTFSIENAVEWREDCRKHAALKAAQPKLKPGMTVRMASPIEFVGGWSQDTFTFIKQFTFEAANGIRVRLPRNWKTRYTWEVISA